MEKLPWEIVVEIISRLPKDSLTEASCVCKSWFNTINENKYLGQGLILLKKELASVSDYASNLYYANYNDQFIKKKYYNDDDIDVDAGDGDGDDVEYQEAKINHSPIKLNDHFDGCRLVGSCNGLICMSDPWTNDPIYVCNPILRESMYLPRFSDCQTVTTEIVPSIQKRKTTRIPRGIMVCGFGYNSSTDEYKVMRVFLPNVKQKSHEYEVQVYTIGKDTAWRTKDKTKYYLSLGLHGVHVNGALHWITNEDCYKLVAFDLANEEFWQVPSPPCFNTGTTDKHSYDVVELGGYLCVTEYICNAGMKIWMSKDSLWTKKYIVVGMHHHLPECDYKAFGLSKGGKILFLHKKGTLMSYDPENENLITIKSYEVLDRLDARTHMKNLVSLKAIAENPMRVAGELVENKEVVEARKRKREHKMITRVAG